MKSNVSSINKLGQSLFEVVFALAITALILTGVVSLSAMTIRNSDYSKNNALATKYAQEAVEWLRGQRDTDWTTFYTHSGTTPVVTCLGTSPITSWGGSCTISGTVFSRSVTLTTDSANLDIIEAMITVSWTDGNGEHRVTSTTRFTHWNP